MTDSDNSNIIKELISKAPDIIEKSSKSPRAYAALIAVLLTIISTITVVSIDSPELVFKFGLIAFFSILIVLIFYLILTAERTPKEVTKTHTKSNLFANRSVKAWTVASWIFLLLPLYGAFLSPFCGWVAIKASTAQNTIDSPLVLKAKKNFYICLSISWSIVLILVIIIILIGMTLDLPDFSIIRGL